MSPLALELGNPVLMEIWLVCCILKHATIISCGCNNATLQEADYCSSYCCYAHTINHGFTVIFMLILIGSK